LDRIDLHVEVARLPFEKMTEAEDRENSESIKVRIKQARALQYKRFKKAKTNSEMDLVELKKYCVLNDKEKLALSQAMKQYNFSGRSLHRILKVARTIADLAGGNNINTVHIGEAIQYRPKSE